ncbi:MAG: glutamate formimidoyltransferase [Bacteroidota bacterium]|nr:glutamate formimidoyltransferase [Bacteroidota bacterium]
MSALIECVPNFSEGRDSGIIQSITREIESVDGVRLLHVDQGKATNRTVVTFVGEPAAIVEAAFIAIRKAGELIDMRNHKGEHPRMGATDVCPLIPIGGISLEETAAWAQKLAERVGRELSIPVYLYASAQKDKSRSDLSVIRSGEYEGFSEKIKLPGWKPDFGPSAFDLQRGATVIGARDFLVAYNVNLNTSSVRKANSIAFDVREAGRIKREGDPVNGKIVRDERGMPVNIPGSLKSVKAIGWYIEEYGMAQISMNLTNLSVTPLHIAFDEVCRKAENRGIRVTGSELVGLIPLQAMLSAGKYFLKKQKRSAGVSEKELIRVAIHSMGLDELRPFKPEEKIIEYLLKDGSAEKMVHLSLSEFADETASESPAPGGGSVAAYLGVLGISLAGMVANLSAIKKGWENRWEEFSEWAEKAQALKQALMRLVDADSRAFQAVMQAHALPKSTETEKVNRERAIDEATAKAIVVPFQVMKLALESMQILQVMVRKGNPNSVSDAGVGALCARSAVLGAGLNVRINTVGSEKDEKMSAILVATEKMEKEAVLLEEEILRELKMDSWQRTVDS